MTGARRIPECAFDLLGFCERCFRNRWLAVEFVKTEGGYPFGVCRSCDREDPVMCDCGSALLGACEDDEGCGG
jgi:hypothetical protein